MIGVRPVLGRDFTQEEDRPGAAGVVLLGNAAWRNLFHGNPGIIGQVVMLDGTAHTVIGVMPPKFDWMYREQMWVPLEPRLYAGLRSAHGALLPIARLKPGATIASARKEAAAIAARLADAYPDDRGYSATVGLTSDDLVEKNTQVIILAMMGAVTCVLLIACANVANLMLARATSRQREIAVRAALGAGRGRIVRQMLTESIVLALISVPFGLLIAVWGIDLLYSGFPPEQSVPWYIDFSMNRDALAYAIVASVVTGLLFGLAPALHAGRGDLQAALRESGRGGSRGRWQAKTRSILVIGEVAMSLVLLVAASLFARSFLNVQNDRLGFNTESLLSTRFTFSGPRYDSVSTRVRQADEIVRRIQAVPGVTSVGVSPLVPLDGGAWDDKVVAEGKPVEKGTEPSIEYAGVTTDWLPTLGITVVRGRSLTHDDIQSKSPVAVIDETMAKRLWAGADPLGKRFQAVADTAHTWYTVVGVCPDLRTEPYNQSSRARLVAFVPLGFTLGRSSAVIVKTSGDPSRMTPLLRATFHAIDPNIPLYATKTMTDVKKGAAWSQRFFTWSFVVFGVVALLLASIGVYGVIAYGVAQRTQEIGVRMALGAARRDVLRLVVGQGVGMAAVGVGVGLLGAAAVTRALTEFLWGVSAMDALSFIGVAVLLTVVAAVASWIPALRAATVSPTTAMRSE